MHYEKTYPKITATIFLSVGNPGTTTKVMIGLSLRATPCVASYITISSVRLWLLVHVLMLERLRLVVMETRGLPSVRTLRDSPYHFR